MSMCPGNPAGIDFFYLVGNVASGESLGREKENLEQLEGKDLYDS